MMKEQKEAYNKDNVQVDVDGKESFRNKPLLDVREVLWKNI